MTDPDETSTASTAATSALAPLPMVRTGLGRDEIVTRLDKAWRRGKLPGFSRKGPGLFRAEAFATPFPSELIATATDADGGTELRFETKLGVKLPLVFAAVLVFTLWPGIWLTESMINTYWPSSQDWISIWWWYAPLWAFSLPYVHVAMKKSRAGARSEAAKQITSVAKAVDGDVVGGA